jgi:hypothetical protein
MVGGFVGSKKLDADDYRIALLLQAVGIDVGSFQRVLEWSLCEHLVAVLALSPELQTGFFAQQDALKQFRKILEARTKRSWTPHDLHALYDRVKNEKTTHYRKPIAYEEYLKLLWQSPLECVQCKRRPPDVILHVDHVVPASRGGSSKRANLQFLCAEHNLRKSNKREVSDSWLDLQ